MDVRKIFFLVVFVSIGMILLLSQLQNQDNISIQVNDSGSYIGTDVPHSYGYDGTGIIISVIDTGVDFNHPDLLGFGSDGKVIGGYDFVDNDHIPEDINGHGTQVAGIIASNGILQGIAPNSKILAYKVSKDGESVPSNLIIKAIEKSIEDGADIINISLGVNQTSAKIDQAVTKAVQNDIVVVTAAGNFGPELSTIGSPGINPNAITVGSTFNNVPSSLVSTLKINDKEFNVFPMVGTQYIEESIVSEIVFGEYGRMKDLSDIDVQNSILLIERGSDIENEIVFFSDKEKNASELGAKAIVVYNNEPGIFFGELIHEFVEDDYNPTIPALSLSREDGLLIKEMLKIHIEAELDVFYHPDFVAYFSSRGPVSPFYIKPDMVAPGAFISTTDLAGNYSVSSGTSFAAPHISGVSALLLQKNPELTSKELKSILMTTSDLVSDEYNKRFPVEVSGSGRVNATKAINAELIITPANLIFNLSPYDQTETKIVKIKGIDDESLPVKFENNQVVDLKYYFEQNDLIITAKLIQHDLGKFEDRMIISHDNIDYQIPILLHVSEGAITINEDDGKLDIVVINPQSWSYAKVTAINKDTGKILTGSIIPNKTSEFVIHEPGEYWIEAKIESDENTLNVFDTIKIETVSEKNLISTLNFPEKAILIVFAIIIFIAIIGLFIRRRQIVIQS